MNIKKTLFWAHLILGCSAAIFIFLMSITGVALTYERQMIKAAQRADYPVATAEQTQQLKLSHFIELTKNYTFKRSAEIQISNEENAPIILKDGRRSVAYLNPYTGEELETPGKATAEFMGKLRAFHRWLTLDGKFSETGRWVNGIANTFFIVLVLSGIYLWLPKNFNMRAFKQKLTLNGKYQNKQARNFQWHNVFGIYVAPVLFVVVFTAIFFSFKWPGQTLKTYVSNDMASLPKAASLSKAQAANMLPLEAQIRAIETEFPQWQTISFKATDKPVDIHVYQVDSGNGGEPHKRASVALNTVTGEVVEQQGFEQLSSYRQARSYIRFLHTGEVYGVVGQTLAGLASLLACLLVYTGVMLSWRRWQNSRSR